MNAATLEANAKTAEQDTNGRTVSTGHVLSDDADPTAPADSENG